MNLTKFTSVDQYMQLEPKIDLSDGLFENLDKLTMSKRMFKKKKAKYQEINLSQFDV